MAFGPEMLGRRVLRVRQRLGGIRPGRGEVCGGPIEGAAIRMHVRCVRSAAEGPLHHGQISASAGRTLLASTPKARARDVEVVSENDEPSVMVLKISELASPIGRVHTENAAPPAPNPRFQRLNAFFLRGEHAAWLMRSGLRAYSIPFAGQPMSRRAPSSILRRSRNAR